MGGSVSAGVDNNDLVDHLLTADYIKTPSVERVFRAVDRGMYFTPSGRESSYKDLAWKNANIHLSAPCIYAEVMENLNLEPGMSFLNLGSGTGYLSTMAGLILGSFGINHGVEIHRDVIDYAHEKLEEFKKSAAAIDEYDFCEPKFVEGNCLQLDSSAMKYDRVYCGAACPPHFENYMKNLIKVGGILVLPLNDRLLRISRVTETVWDKRSVLPVSFASLLEPSASSTVILPIAVPISLMDACRTTIRAILQAAVDREHPELKIRLPPKVKSKKQRTLRRLVIPMFGESESLTIITGLDHQSRGSEADSDENLTREGQGNADATNLDQSFGEAGGSSSSASSDEPSNGHIRLQQRSRNCQGQSSDDSDDPSDSNSSSSSGLTGSYKVQRALFRAMAHNVRNIPFTFRSIRSQGNNTSLSTLHDYDIASSDSSSVPQDCSSDNSMDVDQPESATKEKSETVPMSAKVKCAEGATTKRVRNKRKEAELEESQSSGTRQRASHASGSSSAGDDEKPFSNGDTFAHANKKKNGAKREKVDSGIGEDINNWDISPSDVGSEVDFASDSDSEEDGNIMFKSVRLSPHHNSAVLKQKGEDSPTREPRPVETNNYVIYMRSKIQQLPLPPSIKSYINYFRDM